MFIIIHKARWLMEEEFIKLYTGIYKDLYKFALYTLCNKEDAEDAVGEAVIDAYAQFAKLRDQGAFKSWMFKILFAKCKRRLKSYTNKMVELNEDIEISCADENVRLDEKVDLWNAFSRLEERERKILNLSVIAGFEGKEIAKELGINHNTVRTIRKRALDKMRVMLG